MLSRSTLQLVLFAGCLCTYQIDAATYTAGAFSLNQGASNTFGAYSLTMQSDGNLVLYQGSTALWASNTGGQNCGSNQCYAVFQADGNFVVYNGSTALWSTGTFGNSSATLTLSTNLPHLEITNPNSSILWANSYTFSSSNFQLQQGASVSIGSELLEMRSDGNLVMYSGSTALWATGSGGHSCGTNQCYAIFQSDGNFVIYDGSTAIWNSGTWGYSSAQFFLSASPPYFEILGTSAPGYPIKEYIHFNGRVIAIENQ